MSQRRIYLDLPREMQRMLEDSGFTIKDILRREGYDLALDILPEELPGSDEAGRERGIGTVLMGTAALSLSLSASAAMVILALSNFYSEREQAPVLVETYLQETREAPDGTLSSLLVKDKVFKMPERVASISEIEAKLNLTDGVTVRFRTGKGAAD